MHQDGATGSIDLRRLRVWATLLKETQPDLVHVRGLGNEGFHGALAARLAGCPRILVSVHGTARDLTGPASLKRRAIVTGLEPATLWMATHVTTVCESAARRGFVQRHAAKFVGPIVNGVEIPARTSQATLTDVRSELDLAPEDVAVISVGRLSHEKGHRDLAEGFRLLPMAQRSVIVFVLVGDGPDAADIEELYRRSGVSTRFLGRRLDVPRLLAASDIFAFPSLHENLSNALLEAMSHALPVVATRVGGNTEVLAYGGGILVSAGDPRGLAGALAELVADRTRRLELGDTAASVVRDHYSKERMVEVLDTTYRQILQGTRP